MRRGKLSRQLMRTVQSYLVSTAPPASTIASHPSRSPAEARRVDAQFRELAGLSAYGEQAAQAVMQRYHSALRREREEAGSTTGPLTSSTATSHDGRAKPPTGEGTAPPLSVPLTTRTSSSSIIDDSFSCLRFLRGDMRSYPNDESIEDLLKLGEGRQWRPDVLEVRHDYIQWLFPLREQGMNWSAPTLRAGEPTAIAHDGKAMTNVLRGLRMMLRFYGMELRFTRAKKTPTTRAGSGGIALAATIRRTRRAVEWAEQYDNLSISAHNYLRISRILQFLGEVGLESVKVAWLRFLMNEIFVKVSEPPPPSPLPLSLSSSSSFRLRTSRSPFSLIEMEHHSSRGGPLDSCTESFCEYWVETPFDPADRVQLKAEVLELLLRGADGEAADEAGHTNVDRASSGIVVTVGDDVWLPADVEADKLFGTRKVRPSPKPTKSTKRKTRQKRKRSPSA